MTHSPDRQPQTVVAWLAAVVGAHGQRAALITDGRECSYRELWTRSGDIARWLLNQPSFEPTSPVALIGPNDSAYLIAYIGVLRAGGVVVPLNERLTHREIDAQLDLVEAVGVLTGEAAGDALASSIASAPVWPIERCTTDRSARSPKLSGNSTACILLTSGSTGRPKGVVHSHGTLLHASLGVATALPLGPGERSIAFLPFYASIPEQGLPVLLTGGTLDILGRFAPDRVAAACTFATSLDAVPTIMSRLLDDADHDQLRRLRWMSFASEPMPTPLLERWWEALPGVRTHQFYGMTECLTITHANDERLRAAPTSVGIPYPTSAVSVVDPSGAAIGDGAQGEVTCRTPARMIGYLGAREATRAVTTATGAIRTGDLGRLTDAGALILTGRLKDLIITGGMNVAPAEIEAVACRHPLVASATVVGIPDPKWGETPVVVAVAQPGAGLLPEELLRFCRSELAGYKRPSAAALVDGIPVTGIGKSAKGTIRQRILEGEIALVRPG